MCELKNNWKAIYEWICWDRALVLWEMNLPGRGLTEVEKTLIYTGSVTGYGQESGVRYHTSAEKLLRDFRFSQWWWRYSESEMTIKDVSGENGDSIFRAQTVQEWNETNDLSITRSHCVRSTQEVWKFKQSRCYRSSVHTDYWAFSRSKLERRSPGRTWRLNFLYWRLIFVGPHDGISFYVTILASRVCDGS